MSINTDTNLRGEALGREQLIALDDDELMSYGMAYRENIAMIQERIGVLSLRGESTHKQGSALRYFQAALGNIKQIQKARNIARNDQHLQVGALVRAARNLIAHADEEDNDDAWEQLEAALAPFDGPVRP